jgi:hypothetical protein
MAKRTRRRSTNLTFGDEPTFGNFTDLNPEQQSSAIGDALNWYNTAFKSKDSQKALLAYVTKNHKKHLPAVRAVSSVSISTYGHLAKIIENGCTDPHISAKLDAYVLKLAEEGKKVVFTQTKVAKKKAAGRVVSIQERVNDQVREYLGEIEGEVDEFVLNDCKKSKYNLYNWLQSREVKGVHTRKIKAYYKIVYAELREVVAGTDEQLNEGYAFLTKAKQRKYAQFIASLISDTDEWIKNCNSKRKIRKRKIKTPAELISKLKYKKADEDYKVSSVDPISILDASQVWVFDTKTRFLHRYVSDVGMAIKGTTLKEWDADQSYRKKIRKPEAVLPVVASGGKVKLRKLMDNIRAKETKVSGRINDEMIIMRTVK